MIRNLHPAIVALAFGLATAPLAAASAAEPVAKTVIEALSGEAALAAQTVDAFHAALQAGDEAKAAGLLDASSVFFEGGEVQRSKAAYAAQHLAADAAYEKGASLSQTYRTGAAAGEMAWIATEGRVHALVGDKQIDRLTTETMILRRTAAGWRIVHVHWSSRAASPIR